MWLGGYAPGSPMNRKFHFSKRSDPYKATSWPLLPAGYFSHCRIGYEKYSSNALQQYKTWSLLENKKPKDGDAMHHLITI